MRGVRHGRCDIDIARREFFQHDAGGERIGARTPCLLGKSERAQTHLGGFLEKIGKQRFLERLQPVGMSRTWPDFALREFAHRVAKFELLGGEMEVVHGGCRRGLMRV
jgi:hypothetical protein